MPTEEQPAHGQASATSHDVTLQALERRVVEQDAEIAQLRSALAQSESRVAELHARNATAGRLELSEPEPEPEPELEPASVPRLIQG
eukprot:COSAG03_NODE_14402_length_465_cov_0.980874_1_plen_86_part_10